MNLAILTIILNMPTKIAGLYGMNVALAFADFKQTQGLLISLIVAFRLSVISFL